MQLAEIYEEALWTTKLLNIRKIQISSSPQKKKKKRTNIFKSNELGLL